MLGLINILKINIELLIFSASIFRITSISEKIKIIFYLLLKVILLV